MKTFSTVTEAFGNTPLVRINKINDGSAGHIYAKLEFYNPTSSVKDRLAIAMIDAAEASGELKPGGTIVEATSGNTGIAVAMVAAARGYKSIFTMPESVSKERRKLIRAFGAELVLTPAGEGMKGAVAEAEKLGNSGAVLVRQFENGAGPAIHYATTGPEIWRDLDGKVDAFICGIGTGGTLNGGEPGPHPIQGIGANFIPNVLDRTVYDEILDASAADAITYARRAAAEEGILAGISSGSTLWAATKVAARPEFAGKNIAVICASAGERYLSTILYEDLAD